jgi:hypothetical protein
LQGSCSFIKTKEVFYSEANCIKVTLKAIKELESLGATVEGTCIEIPGRGV